MKAHLMHRDRDFSAPADFSEARRALIEEAAKGASNGAKT